jgi:hypothetical protein
MFGSPSELLPDSWHRDQDRRALAWSAAQIELSAHLSHALADPDQAEVPQLRSGRPVGLEPAAIILDPQRDCFRIIG